MELLRQRARLAILGVGLVLAFLGLGYRLIDLQVLRHEEFRDLADRSHRLRIPLKGHRGEIFDVRGTVLARSLPARTIVADPSLVGPHADALARVLGPLLATNEVLLASALRPRVRTNFFGQPLLDVNQRPITNKYVVLRRRVPEEEWKVIRAALDHTNQNFGLPTNRVAEIRSLRRSIQPDRVEDEIRAYPNQTLAANILGFTDAEGRGLEGLEGFLDPHLRGVDGYIESERSSGGRELRRFRGVEILPQHGHRVYLTLDARLQLIVEEELAATIDKFGARGGCIVAVHPATGRILASASYPNYNPNLPPLREDDAPRRRNRLVSHTFEPGSTLKLVAATAAMNERLFDIDDPVDCGLHGRWQQQFGRETVRLTDVHPMKERYSPLERVIAESSNIGTFHLALALGKDRYADYLLGFGFGQRTGVRLPVEEHGILHPTRQWSVQDFSRIAMGYTVAVTPLQLVMAMSSLANQGRLMRPQIIDRIVAADGTVLSQPRPELIREVCRPEVSAKVRQALRQVVEDGTGSLVKMDRYTVAGKTGTAEIAPYQKRHEDRRYHSSFVGFFPTEAPELCIAVVIEDPNIRIAYYGGRVAGPAFRNVAQRAAEYLGIRPDLPRADDERTAHKTRPHPMTIARTER